VNWFLYALAAWFLAQAVTMVRTVGEPRDPLPSGTVAALVAINIGIVYGLVVAAGRI